jgi:hypothetical protein
MDDLQQEFLAGLAEGGREALFPHGITDDVSLELYDFLAAVRDGRPPEIDGLEGLRYVAVCLACYESHVAGGPVRVQDVLDGRVDAYQRPIDAHWNLA